MVIIYLPLPDVMTCEVLVKVTDFQLALEILLFLNSFFYIKWKERLKIMFSLWITYRQMPKSFQMILELN